jgi:hypothetical protein
MRHITFGKYTASYDGAYFGKKRKLFGENEIYLHILDSEYKMYDVKRRWSEEWPSEIYNYQDNLALKPTKKSSKQEIPQDKPVPHPTKDESNESEVQDE